MESASPRRRMVEEQLIGRGIYDRRVLDAMEMVERHRFVPPGTEDSAYGDHPLPVGEGQTISQPYMVALMTELLELKGSEKTLEIGTGSGYQAAILAELSREVYSVERLAVLADRARQTLDALGYSNIYITVGDGSRGWPDHAPYDRIIVTAGAPAVPSSLVSQLGQGGRMVIPVGSGFSQTLTLVEKKNNRVSKREIAGCVFVPLLGEEGWPGIREV